MKPPYRPHGGLTLGHALLLLVFSSVGLAAPPDSSARAKPQRTSVPEIVLFPFDDYSLPFSKGLLLTMVEGRKTRGNHGTGFDPEHPGGPVMSRGQPGDPDYPKIYFEGTVLRIEGEYRMWYNGLDKDWTRQVCYAVSQDGIHWEKPKLGLVHYNGSTANNLVLIDDKESVKGASCQILYEPDDPDPDRRFKMIREVTPTQILAAFSPDGLRWKNSSQNPVVRGSSMEPGGLIKFGGCYYLNGHGGPVPHPLPKAKKRMMVTYASYDFEHWTEAAHVSFRRDNVPPRLPSDFDLHRGEQVHDGASLWNRGNVVLGFYGQYHNVSDDRSFSVVDIGFIVSHDAVHFKEPVPDFKIVPAYEEEDDARPRLLQGAGFENIGERTLFWYSIWADPAPDSPSGVKIATWPRDRLGYFSPAPNQAGAHCLSKPLTPPQEAARVYINADGLSSTSGLRVELLDERFNPLPGYSGEASLLVESSGFRQPVGWQGRETLEGVARPFRVRVTWTGSQPQAAQLFAVYVE